MIGHDDDKDARAFRADGFAELIDAIDAMPPPIFHAATRRGPRQGMPLCGASGYTRDSAYAVTCETCKQRMARRAR
jgi:hypothetical protein